MLPRLLFAVACLNAVSLGADYDGPKPAKPDIPYLLHAGNLMEPEIAEAREENKKGETTYVIDGAGSPVKTPLAEPIFIIDAQQLAADRIELYKMDVRNGRREVTLSQKRRRNGPKPIHLLVTRLSGRLYRIEADEHLDPGEYSLSPNDSNRVFCFQVF